MTKARFTMCAALTLALGSAAAARDEGAGAITLSGGLADLTPTGEFYRGVPRAAVPQRGTACMVAKRYLDLINAGRYGEVAGLFAADALLLEPMRGPSGGAARGSREIDAFYTARIGGMRPHVIGVAYVGSRDECMLQNAAKLPPSDRYSLSSINHFVLDRGGKISRMVAFARPRGR